MDLACSRARDKELGAASDACTTLERGDRGISNGAQQVALFMVGSGGGGHKASAIAVRDCFLSEQDGSCWSVHVEFIDVGEVAQKVVGGPNGDDWYNWFMQNDCYWLASGLGHIAAVSAPFVRSSMEIAFEDLWNEWQPTVVVSFVPFLNVQMRTSLWRACPECLLLTVVTDMTSTTAHPWIDPWDSSARNHIIVAGTTQLIETAKELGYRKSLLQMSGMVVHPAFYKAAAEAASSASAAVAGAASGARERRVVVYFGGHPPSRAERVARSLLETLPDWTVIVLCGNNAELFNRLQEQHQQALSNRDAPDPGDLVQCNDRDLVGRMAACIPEGFLSPSELANCLASAVFIVGKPGPGAVSEAFVCGVPFVSESGKAMPQEEPVLDWLQASGVGLVVDDLECLPHDLLDRLKPCTAALQQPGLEPSKKAKLPGQVDLVTRDPGKCRPNRAVFEVTEYLKEFLRSPQDKFTYLRQPKE